MTIHRASNHMPHGLTIVRVAWPSTMEPTAVVRPGGETVAVVKPSEDDPECWTVVNFFGSRPAAVRYIRDIAKRDAALSDVDW